GRRPANAGWMQFGPRPPGPTTGWGHAKPHQGCSTLTAKARASAWHRGPVASVIRRSCREPHARRPRMTRHMKDQVVAPAFPDPVRALLSLDRAAGEAVIRLLDAALGDRVLVARRTGVTNPEAVAKAAARH